MSVEIMFHFNGLALMVFMLEIRLKFKEAHPLLSGYDIRDLLCHFLPHRDVTAEEVIRQMLKN